MNLKDLLRLDSVDVDAVKRDARITLCRHKAHRNADLNEAIQRDAALLNAYQCEQGDDVFSRSGLILAFLPDWGQRALFVGAFENQGRIGRDEYLTLFPGNPVGKYPGYEHVGASTGSNCYYRLNPAPVLVTMQRRLVVDWGPSSRAWCQFILEKDVTEIYPKGYVEPFVDYYDVLLSFDQLQEIIGHPDGNRLWHEKLRSIAAVYLITDMDTGRHYVGSACGIEGLLGRWTDYVYSGGHGGNAALVARLQEVPGAHCKFQFSILRVLDRSTTRDQVVAIESRMKQKLGSRVFGLNPN